MVRHCSTQLHVFGSQIIQSPAMQNEQIYIFLLEQLAKISYPIVPENYLVSSHYCYENCCKLLVGLLLSIHHSTFFLIN